MFESVDITKKAGWILIGIIALQLMVAVSFGSQKESWHLDEIYTQGLSNSYYKPFVDQEDLMQWKEPSFYKDYLTVQEGERFAYGSVFYNQTQDVHPPLYYVLIHTISSITPEKFSKWYGIGLNMFLFIGVILLLYALSKKYTGSTVVSLLVCAAYGFSAGAMGNLMFIRMYVMLTFFGLLFTTIHEEMIRKERQDAKTLVGVFLVAMAGFLTQYLFLVFAFFGFLSYGYQLVRQHRAKDLVVYTFVLLAALTCATLIFPAWVHLFLQGGIENNQLYAAWANGVYPVKALFFLFFLVRGLFGSAYMAVAIGFLSLALVLFRMIVLRNRSANPVSRKPEETSPQPYKRRMTYWIVWTSLGSCLMILYISPFNDAYRYISFMVPLWVMAIIPAVYRYFAGMRWTRKRPVLVLAVVIAALSLYSYAAGAVDYLYQSRPDNLDARIEAYADLPAICVTANNVNMTAAIPLLEKHKYSCYVSPLKAGAEAHQMLELKGAIGNPIVIYLPSWREEERGVVDMNYIREIAKACGYDHYTKILDIEESGLRTSAYLMN